MTTIGVRHVQFRREVVDLPYEPGATTVMVTVVLDGRTLQEWIGFATTHDASEWSAMDDGDDAASMLRGETGRDFPPAAEGEGRRAELYVCCCTCSGCHPLLVDIQRGDAHVRWRGLAAGSGEPDLDGTDDGLMDLEFVFARDEYDRAVDAFEAWAEPVVDLRP